MEQSEKWGYIFGRILTLANRLQVLGDQMDEQITLKQWLLVAIIMKLEPSTPTISEVSGITGNSRQNVKKMASILEKQGFVKLVKDEQDARIVRIHLTAKCKAYFEQRAGKEQHFMSELFDSFDEALTDGLYQGLMRLANNVNQMERIDEQGA